MSHLISTNVLRHSLHRRFQIRCNQEYPLHLPFRHPSSLLYYLYMSWTCCQIVFFNLCSILSKEIIVPPEPCAIHVKDDDDEFWTGVLNNLLYFDSAVNRATIHELILTIKLNMQIFFQAIKYELFRLSNIDRHFQRKL